MCEHPSICIFSPSIPFHIENSVFSPVPCHHVQVPKQTQKTLKQMRKGRRKRTLRTEELARDVEGFTSHDDDLLAVKQLLCNSAGQATKEVSLAVDDDL